MLPKYAKQVQRLGADARAALAEDLEIELPQRGPIVGRLEGAGLCSADVVVVLLRRGLVAEAERVAGTRIKRYRPNTPPPPRPAAVPVRHGDDRHVTAVARPCPAGSTVAARYGLLRRGMTLRAAMARGVLRRDLRTWVRLGWVEVEGGAL